jgi:hypothetical protein
MRRIAVVFCLVAGLLAQGFALAGQISSRAGDGGMLHVGLHLDSVAHHHEADGSIRQDQSKQSHQHLQSDCCMQLLGALPVTVALASLPRARPLAESAPQGHDSPFLEGLRRPPR